MGILLRGVLTFGVVILAFYAYNPLPPGVEQPLQLNLLNIKLRLVADIAKVAEFVGINDSRIVKRDLLNWFAKEPMDEATRDDGLRITETSFGGIKVRLFNPPRENDDKLRKGLVFVHGGGFVIGSVDFYHKPLAKIAQETGMFVVAPTYRLSPENPAPAAMEDCYTASSYFFSHAHEWGVDPKKITIMGDSAGGNMAAVLSFRYRDEGAEPQFASQVLIYPWTQAMDLRLPAYLENDPHMTPLMTQAHMALFTVSYIGIHPKHIPKFQKNQHVRKATRNIYSNYFKLHLLPGHEEEEKEEEAEVDEDLAREVEGFITNPYNFPLMAESVANVPPALVLTVGYDTIRDDGLLYLHRLKEAGVQTEHYHDKICWHVAFSFAIGDGGFDCGARILEHIIEYLKR